MIYISMRQRTDSAQVAMDYLADNDPVAWILVLIGGRHNRKDITYGLHSQFCKTVEDAHGQPEV